MPINSGLYNQKGIREVKGVTYKYVGDPLMHTPAASVPLASRVAANSGVVMSTEAD